MRPIYKNVLSGIAGFVLGRVTKAPELIRITEEHESTEQEMKEALVQFIRVGMAAFLEIDLTEGKTVQEFQTLRREAMATVTARYSTDARVPEFARPLLPALLDEITDPAQIRDALSPRVMRLMGDMGQLICRRLCNGLSAPAKEGVLESLTGLKTVLRGWEQANRPDAHTRTLRHVIGSLATV